MHTAKRVGEDPVDRGTKSPRDGWGGGWHARNLQQLSPEAGGGRDSLSPGTPMPWAEKQKGRSNELKSQKPECASTYKRKRRENKKGDSRKETANAEQQGQRSPG